MRSTERRNHAAGSLFGHAAISRVPDVRLPAAPLRLVETETPGTSKSRITTEENHKSPTTPVHPGEILTCGAKLSWRRLETPVFSTARNNAFWYLSVLLLP